MKGGWKPQSNKKYLNVLKTRWECAELRLECGNYGKGVCIKSYQEYIWIKWQQKALKFIQENDEVWYFYFLLFSSVRLILISCRIEMRFFYTFISYAIGGS